jgi:RNA polymerase sigma factor FliA
MLDGTGMFDAGETGATEGAGYGMEGMGYRRQELRLLREKLLAHVDGLKPQARHVVRCHYVQEMSFDAIAAAMGLTKGRVSQIHREALLLLRNELRVVRSSDLVC